MSQFFVSIISTLTNLENELILNSSESNVIMKKYRAYIQQQHVRLETLQNVATSSIIQTSVSKKKSFYIKIMKDKSDLFAEDSYKE